MNGARLLGAPWRNAPSRLPIGWRCGDASPAVPWAEFHGRIGAWQALLDGLAAPGQRWLLHLREPLEFAAALIALWERGDSAILPADDRPETLAGLDRLSRARLGDVTDAHRAGSVPAEPRWGGLDARYIAVSLYTSGSTGEPQRLDKTFAQLDAELATHARFWPLAGRLVISQVSHQHIYGLLFAVLRPLCERAPMAMATCRYPETLSAWLQHLAEARRHAESAPPGAVLVSAPPTLGRLPNNLDWQAAPSLLAYVYSSGAPLPRAASDHAASLLGVAISEIYGSSESGGIAWRNQQQGEAWTPLPGVEVRADEQGHLWLRSPYLASAEWQRQADRIAPETQGFRLLGRTDRIAKVGGKRLSLSGMDRALGAHPGVLQARTVTLAQRDARLGAIVQLVPEQVPNEHASRRTLIEALRARLLEAYEPTVVPRYWRFVESWPTNPQGKLSAAIAARLFRDLSDHRQPRWLGIEPAGDGRCRVTLEVPERLVYLQGHFEGRPVVPGVVMVQWAIELAGEHLALTGRFHHLERVRFPQLLLPGERVRLSLAVAATAEGNRLAFSLDGRQGCHASGKATFHVAEEHDA